MWHTKRFSLVLNFFTSAAVVGGVWFGISQIRGLREQLRLTVFTSYTERYSKIIGELPDTVNVVEESVLEDPQSNVNELTAIFRQFFDLCSEEYYLRGRKLLDTKVWKLWEKGMRYHMKSKSFQAAWYRLQNEGYDDDFKTYMTGLIPAEAH